MFWQTAADDRELLVTRRIGANEQTAAADFRIAASSLPGHGWGDVDMMLMAANERDAYFLAHASRSTTPAVQGFGVRGVPAAPTAGVWWAAFELDMIAETAVARQRPAGFVLAESVHGDRAVRRWGVPIETADEAIAFVGPHGEQHVLPATSTVGPFGPELIFEPGGIRYLQVLPRRTARGGVRSCGRWPNAR